MQTSIEWFIEHLLGNGLLRLTKEEHKLYSELRDKAKEMHKQEMEKTWFDSTLQFDNSAEMNDKKLFEEYYQETFKKD